MRRFVPPRSTPMEKLLIMEASRVPSGISNFQSCDFSPGGIFLRASSKACSPAPEWVDGCASNAEDIAPDRRDPLTSHLIYALTELHSRGGRTSRESFRHIVRNGLRDCESSVARQTISQFSNVGDTVSDVLDLVFCFCGCCGEERSVRSLRNQARILGTTMTDEPSYVSRVRS